MAVDTLIDKVKFLAQGASLANVAPPPGAGLDYISSSVTGTATPGSNYVATNGRIGLSVPASVMTKLTSSSGAESPFGTGSYTQYDTGGTIEAVVGVNPDWPVGGVLFQAYGVSVVIESAGVLRIRYPGTAPGDPGISRAVSQTTEEIAFALTYKFSQYHALIGATPLSAFLGDECELFITEQGGAQTYHPGLLQGYVPSRMPQEAGVAVGNAGGSGAEIDPSPAEFSINIARTQRGYLAASANYQSSLLVTAASTALQSSGSLEVTATEKDSSGATIGVFSGTTPLTGYSVAQAFAVCFNQVSSQLPAADGIPAASTDVPAVNISARLMLPIRALGRTWTVTYTPISGVQSSSFFGGTYCSGSGLAETFDVVLTKNDPSGLGGFKVYRAPAAGHPYRQGDPTLFITSGDNLDAAVLAIRDSIISVIGGSGVVSAISSTQSKVSVTVPPDGGIDWFAPNGLAYAFQWLPKKVLSAATGVSKLFGLRVTANEDRVAGTSYTFPTLPWPTSNISSSSPFWSASGSFVWDDASNPSDSITGKVVYHGHYSEGWTVSKWSATSGLWYFEAVIGFYASVGVTSDVGPGSAGLSTSAGVSLYMGPGGAVLEVNSSGNTLETIPDLPMMSTATYPDFTPASGGALVVGVILDVDARTVVFMLHTAVGMHRTASFTIPGSGPVFVAAGSDASAATEIYLNDTSSSYEYAAPSGYAPIDLLPSISGADVTAGSDVYLDAVLSSATLALQANFPDSYASADVTLDDIAVGQTVVIDSDQVGGTSSVTLSAFTSVAAVTVGTPVNWTADTTLDDVIGDASAVASTPIDTTADMTLDDVVADGLILFLAPSEMSTDQLLDEITSNAWMDIQEPNRLTAEITLPVLRAQGTVARGSLDGGALVLPTMTAAGRFGSAAAITLPSLKAAGSGTATVVLRGDLTLPALTASGSGRLAGQSTAFTTLPAMVASGSFGEVASITLPAITGAGDITTGAVLTADITLPMLVAAGTVTPQAYARAAIILPAIVPGGLVTARITLPSLQVMASVAPVVAVAYETYVMNMSRPLDQNPRNNFEAKVDQVTRYTNYPFTQVVRLGASYYGVATDGLYLLEGDTDNGAPIDWAFETCMTDFDASEKKNVASTYLGGKAGPTVSYTIKSGESADQLYASTITATTALRNHRQKYGLGRRERYYALGVAGQGDMAIDSIEFEVSTTSRRI